MKTEEIMKDSAYNYKLTEMSYAPASQNGALQEELEGVRLHRLRTRMTRIGRIFTDILNRCVSVCSVFHHKYNEPQISRNFGLRSVGVCEAYPSFDKPFLKIYADERRYRINNELVLTDTNSGRSEFVSVSTSSY
jgi:hypothetical protein